jgi:two-component system, chemotaxis family, sensor kinase CheA
VEIDIARFRAAFFEEAADNAVVIESSLLELERASGDTEILHRIFRAAHSIKGGGATFGLDALAHFTHGMENVLDQLRQGAIAVTPALVGLLFRACDALKRLLQAARDGEAGDAGTGPLLAELLSQASPLPDSGEAAAAGAPDLADAPDIAPPASPATEQHRYRIRFVPDSKVFERGLDPVLLLRDLAALGDLSRRELELDGMPSLDDLNPELCYLGWQLELVTDRPERDVRDVFSFVEDSSTIEIAATPEPAPRAGAIDTPAPLTDDAGGVLPPAAVHPDPLTAKPAAEALGAPGPARTGGGTKPAATLRVSVDKLDQLVNLVGELVIAQSVISQALEDLSPDSLSRMRDAVVEMERHTRDLQERVLSVRMVPIGSVFSRFQRLVRDLGESCNKRIALELAGEETEMDKGIIEQIVDPITHLIRNAIDHGLEPPEERERLGKPRVGQLLLTASHQGGNVSIEVSDDGRGINWQRVREKGIAQGLLRADEAASEERLQELLFAPGFSTAAAVTDISGRGVGMDVVRRNVDALSGVLTLSSELGKGTRVKIKLPLTLAIVDGLTLRIGDRVFVLPLLSVLESFRPLPEQLKTVLGSGELVRVRGEPIVLVRLYQVLGVTPEQVDPCRALVVIVEAGGSKLGLLVDEIMGQAQVVVKSLETNYRRVDGIMGATIMGDGRVGLILDVEGVARRSGHDRSKASAAGAPEQRRLGVSGARAPLQVGEHAGA